MALLARLFLQQEHSILAEAYQELMRQKNECYGYCDALDALIHEATYNSKHFIEVLRPQLKTIAQSSGSAVFEVEYLD
ncbi:hypothetical protein PLA107_032975 (plasmid) [Pseudomonas amygdali pv. lachrymans str. M301315]|uniref:Uncharacterized protein n=2 Tax=Pseudomonas amygdali TaxID=47877 RepID=A0AAD0PWH1_PSEAV|nr:hypothetical protein PLA107_032975 [Pseudomonas amygdali pv. lachrymans str. M301315]